MLINRKLYLRWYLSVNNSKFNKYHLNLWFTEHNAVFQEIFMDIKTGTEAKNYDDVC